MLLFPTIRHSGSHFILNLFGSQVGSHSHPDRVTGDLNEIVFCHVDEQNQMLTLAEDHPVIIPLRHPKAIARSWQARNKDLKTLCRDFHTLIDQYDRLKPLYLPLDSPKREDFLEAINQALGVQLVTDWIPKGVDHSNDSIDYRTVVADPCIQVLCAEIKPFLDRFYDS